MDSCGEVCYDGGMSGKAAPVTITSEEREVLEGLAISRTAPYREVQRARLVLPVGKPTGSLAKKQA